MKTALIALTVLVFVSSFFSCCGKQPASSTKHINLGDFVFQFPGDYKLIREQGIDSYVGKVSNGNITFHFDYGYYSHSLDNSIEEYLAQDTWKWHALSEHGYLPSGTDLTAISKATKLISSKTNDSVHYSNLYEYKGDSITYALTIPNDIRTTSTTLDTTEHVVYKFVRKRNSVGLYVRDLNKFSHSSNAPLALCFEASDLSPTETEKAFQLLRTCTPLK